MKAFHGDPKVKEKYVTRLLAHFEDDELGIPKWLTLLEDRIFEELPDKRAKHFPLEFLNAIHPGADLEKIMAPFLIFVMESTLDKFDHTKYPNVKKAIDTVIALYRNPAPTLIELSAAAHSAVAAADAVAVAAASAAVDIRDTAAHASARVSASAAYAASSAAYAASFAANAANYAASHVAAAAANAASAAHSAAYVAASAAAYVAAYAANTAYAANAANDANYAAKACTYIQFADKLIDLISKQLD